MSDSFFHLSVAWWELVIRAVIVYFVVMLMLRVSGFPKEKPRVSART